MFDSDFFKSVSVLCRHLEPVASPLLGAVGNAAEAVHNAQIELEEAKCATRALEAQYATIPKGTEEQIYNKLFGDV